MPHDAATHKSVPDTTSLPLHNSELKIESVLGASAAPEFAAELHRLAHDGLLDTVWLPRADMARRRMRVRSAAGRDVAIALPRTQSLFDGAILWMTAQGALITRAEAEQWLRLTPSSQEAALMLGYHAGNLHWRVRFAAGALFVALEAPAETYLARLESLRESLTVQVEASAA